MTSPSGPPDPAAFRAFFLGELEAAATEIEATQRLPDRLVEQATWLGVPALTMPRTYGGLGLGISAYLPYLEIAAMGPGAGRMLVHVCNGVWRPIAKYGTAEQRSLLPRLAAGEALVAFCLTERAGGSGRDTHSRAVRTGDDWEIRGEKHLITFADRATDLLVVAATDDRRAAGSLTAFLVPRSTPGLVIDANQHTMGLAGTGHGALRYDPMLVADELRLGGVGQGLEVAMCFLDFSRLSLATCMVGLAQRALDEAVGYARRRVTFGRPIADRQAIQVHLAEMQAQLAAGRALVQAVAAEAEAGQDVAARAATAKLFCLEMVGRVTDRALRVHGGYGYTKDAPIERIYRDARGFWFEEGTAEIQQLVVSRQLLGEAT